MAFYIPYFVLSLNTVFSINIKYMYNYIRYFYKIHTQEKTQKFCFHQSFALFTADSHRDKYISYKNKINKYANMTRLKEI